MEEVNFDGIVGLTHTFSGLSFGNTASMANENLPSSPRRAALQGLEKMKLLADLGIKQAVLPPHERPHLPTLRALGFSGAGPNIPAKAFKFMPEILYKASSAAAMWTANAATITPSIDSIDRRVHITPANLSSMFHRSIESPTTARILKAIFPDPLYFTHHSPLPLGEYFPDEGAANGGRFCKTHGGMGVNLFVHGKYTFQENDYFPKKFPARQSFEAIKCIVNSHELFPGQVVIAQQNPEYIDAGVFHNDVTAVSNRHLFFFHENAYVNMDKTLEEIRVKVENTCDISPIFISVPNHKVPIQRAVKTYLFNSQLIDMEAGMMALVCPIECQTDDIVRHFLDELLMSPDNPIEDIHFVNLMESMQNGGGPACLRLRVVLSPDEINATNPGIFMNDKLYHRLVTWVNKHYRDILRPADLADPKLVEEGQSALNELTEILKIGRVYDFQR